MLKCLPPFFHAFAGCDQVLFFAGRKKAAWSKWNHFSELTISFFSMSLLPILEDITNHSASIERFVVLLYDHTSTISTVNECRKNLFAKKDWPIKGTPPMSDALMQHLKRALYKGSCCWAQSLVANQELPDPCLWGWKSSDNSFKVQWIALPKASEVCHELICCGCNKQKGCKRHCKCVKASLKCTALCKCGSDCEHVE